MVSIGDHVWVEIDMTSDRILEAYDGLSEDEQNRVLQGLEEHFTDSQIGGDILECISRQIAEACNLSAYDYQKANQYLARYGFKLVRAI